MPYIDNVRLTTGLSGLYNPILSNILVSPANLIRVRGIKKVTTHLLLCCIALIAGTIAVNQSEGQAA